ncbi:MAG: ArsR/SmtB family transcription factor [Candidatus Hodarchaeales archaeon]|jgi:predicted transcriptional regulator
MSNNPTDEIELILKILSYQIESNKSLRFQDIDKILHLLSNRTRRRMLVELAEEEGFVNDLVNRLNDHPQSIIRHLEVLKKQNLVVGKERPRAGPGRPRLYYTLFPDVARFIRKDDLNKDKSENLHNCSSFPRLNSIKHQLDNRITHSEQRKIVSEVETMKNEHEMALKVCNEILDTLKKRVTKIKVQ